jgi:hypothetical protein
VSNGLLAVNGTHSGAGNYTVVSGARLGGSGTISGSGTVSIHNGGTVSPGQSPGTLTTPNLLLQAGAVMWDHEKARVIDTLCRQTLPRHLQLLLQAEHLRLLLLHLLHERSPSRVGGLRRDTRLGCLATRLG